MELLRVLAVFLLGASVGALLMLWFIGARFYGDWLWPWR